MIVGADQTVSIHTGNGTVIASFPSSDLRGNTWSRDLREVSRSTISVVTEDYEDEILDIRPWLHWVSVWDGPNKLWTGVIQQLTIARNETTIISRDLSTFMDRTRTPITKSWETVDAAVIANDLWTAMIEHHQLDVEPIVRLDPSGDIFDFRAEADSKMLTQTNDDLVKMGLRWCVVAGIPILGPAPRQPIASLGEDDFMVDMTIVRDGNETFNDIRLKGQNWASNASTPLAGLRLQTIVTIDDLFGVSNIDRAAQQYLRHTAAVRDALVIPGAAALSPDAPVTVDELIPGQRFVLTARGITTLVELEAMEVSSTPGNVQVSVTLESVVELPELATDQGGALL